MIFSGDREHVEELGMNILNDAFDLIFVFLSEWLVHFLIYIVICPFDNLLNS